MFLSLCFRISPSLFSISFDGKRVQLFLILVQDCQKWFNFSGKKTAL